MNVSPNQALVRVDEALSQSRDLELLADSRWIRTFRRLGTPLSYRFLGFFSGTYRTLQASIAVFPNEGAIATNIRYGVFVHPLGGIGWLAMSLLFVGWPLLAIRGMAIDWSRYSRLQFAGALTLFAIVLFALAAAAFVWARMTRRELIALRRPFALLARSCISQSETVHG